MAGEVAVDIVQAGQALIVGLGGVVEAGVFGHLLGPLLITPM
jgi:hypothetical protein